MTHDLAIKVADDSVITASNDLVIRATIDTVITATHGSVIRATPDSMIRATHDSVIRATHDSVIRATHPGQTCSTEVLCPLIVWVFHKALIVWKGDKREDAGQIEGGVNKNENILGRYYRSAVNYKLSTVGCLCQLFNAYYEQSLVDSLLTSVIY